MRLRPVTPQRWAEIATILSDLCDEIAEDPYPNVPVEDTPEPAAGEWPEDAVAVRIWQDLQGPTMLADIHAHFPSLGMGQVKGAMTAASGALREAER